MNRILSLLLAVMLAGAALTGCAPKKEPFPAASMPDASTPSFPETPVDTEQTPPEAPDAPHTAPEWQTAYLTLLEDLIRQHGRSTVDADSYITTSGVKHARLLDFNGDGVRELVVVIDRTVQLYTLHDQQPKRLFEGEIGCRLGQTDVSYHFLLNAQSDPISLILYHSTDEWNEDAITVISMNEKGGIKQRELLARSSLRQDLPSLDNLNECYIDGTLVTKEEYLALRGQLLEGAMELEPDFGTYPVTPDELTAQLQFLRTSTPADYLLPDSDCRIVTDEELAALNARQLRLARNEIYARYGRIFTAPDLKAYFSEQPWYQPRCTPETMEEAGLELLNRYELANIERLKQAEDSGTAPAAEPLTEAQAKAIAVAYWDFVEGSLDEATGSLKAISSDGTVSDHGQQFWSFQLRRMKDNTHWTTMERIYVNAQTGLVSNTTKA